MRLPDSRLKSGLVVWWWSEKDALSKHFASYSKVNLFVGMGFLLEEEFSIDIYDFSEIQCLTVKPKLLLAIVHNLRIHDLRLRRESWQSKNGASLIIIISERLNHQNQATTAIYARLDLDPVRESVNTATTAMLKTGGLKSPKKKWS